MGAAGASEVLLARALAALEVDLGHSRAMCPERPQNKQSLFSRRRFRSASVSLPSLPSLLSMLEERLAELEEAEAELLEPELEDLELELELEGRELEDLL